MVSLLQNPNSPLDHIKHQIMWSRLIAVVEEQAQTLVRTAFSTAVREAGDLSAGVFDSRGRMLAQAVTGTPGHVNSMANAVKHFLQRYPLNEMAEGDHYISNDPWLTSGHLHDFTLVSPAFFSGRAVGLFASTVHVVDIGGLGLGPDGRQVFEEGLAIPIMPLARHSEFNDDLLKIVSENVRMPDQVVGDLYALASCNDEGARRLDAMMVEFQIENLENLGEYILVSSKNAKMQAIRELPSGKYCNELTMDGYDSPVVLCAELTIDDNHIHVDYSGSSSASRYGINVVMNYCEAYTAYGVNCVIAPHVPNNAGSLAAITVSAPEGSILNVKRPWPVAARHTIGHMLPDVIFGCLQQVIPERVPAEGAASLWNPQINGGGSVVDHVYSQDESDCSSLQEFSSVIFHCGGAGARPNKDGLDVTAFPSGVRTIPIEATETIAPIVFWRREFRENSCGSGQYRGGLGQVIEIGGANGSPFTILCNFERINNPARGRQGGLNGAPGAVSLASGEPIRPKGRQSVPSGDRICLALPGGGGFGEPFERDPNLVALDIRDGIISADLAKKDYGVIIEDNIVDLLATNRARKQHD